MNKEQQAAALKLKAQARLRLKEKQKSAPVGSANDGALDAMVYGVDSMGQAVGRGIEAAGEFIGSEGVQNYGKGLKESNEQDIARRNYQRPEYADGVFTNLKEGEIGNALSSLGYTAAESGPSIATGVAASAGAVLGGVPAALLAGSATALGGVQALGETKLEEERKGIQNPTTIGDIGTAAASAAVELIPGGKATSKAGKLVLGFGKEAAQEAGQEGLIMGNAALDGAEYTSDEAMNRLIEAGIAGGAISKGIQVGSNVTAGAVKGVAYGVKGAAQTASDYASKTDSTDDGRQFDAVDASLANDLVEAVGGDMSLLANVDSKSSNKGAQSYAKAVQAKLRGDSSVIMNRLNALAKERGDTDAQEAIAGLRREFQNHTSAKTDVAFNRLEAKYGNESDFKRLYENHLKLGRLGQYVESDGDLGGLSKLTRFMDPTDGRNSGFGRNLSFAGLGITGALASPIAAGALISTKMGINRAAKKFDTITNRRSRIKRYVDSVKKAGVVPNEFTGPDSSETLNQLKALVAEAKKEQALRMKQETQINGMRTNGVVPSGGIALDKKQTASLERVAKEAKEARQQELLNSQHNEITAKIFEGGKVPEGEGNDFFEPYSLWEKFTGTKTADTLPILEKLEAEGKISKGFAQRFRENPRSLASDPETYNAQQLVKQRAGKYGHRAKPKLSGDQVIQKLEATKVKATTNSRYKEEDGIRRAKNVEAEIEARTKSMTIAQARALRALKTAIDNPMTVTEDRYRIVDETLPQIFNKPSQIKMWTQIFDPLAAVGNPKAIKSKYDEEVEQEEAFKEKVEATRKKATKEKGKKSVAKPKKADKQPELEPRSVETTAEKALEKLKTPTKEVEPPAPAETTTAGNKQDQAKEPDAPSLDKSKAASDNDEEYEKETSKGNKASLSKMVKNRIEQFDNYEALFARSDELTSYMESLPKSPEGRIEALIYEGATSQITVNQLVDNLVSRTDIPVDVAASTVQGVLQKWVSEKKVNVFRPKGSSWLKVDDAFKKDEDGNKLSVLQIKPVDPTMKDMLNIAKAVAKTSKLVNQEGAQVEYRPGQLREDGFRFIKDYPDEAIDDSFAPIFEAVNYLRNMKFAIDPDMLTQLEDGLKGIGQDKMGKIREVLYPVADQYYDKDGKLKVTHDEAPVNVLSQLLWQFGNKDERADTSFRQEVMVGANGRLYTLNGSAHSQAGSIMKGLIRSATKAAPGEAGLDRMFHDFGNLLGQSKRSPEARRNMALKPGVAQGLIDFAKDPYGRNTFVSSKKNLKAPAKLVEDGESFFEVLRAGMEIKRMVDFAIERDPSLSKLSPEAILSMPSVRADLAANFQTDYVVQMDASNNAYQLVGTVMGYEKVLREVGLWPDEGIDPDSADAPDIYFKSAMAVWDQIPQLKALRDAGLPDSAVRGAMKNAISTYTYAAEYQSRRKSFEKQLKKIAGLGNNVIGINGDGLINLDPSEIENLKGSGHVYESTTINQDGSVTTEYKNVRVFEDSEGKFRIGRSTSKVAGRTNTEKVGESRFATIEDAIREAAASNLYGQMNSKLIKDFEGRYPGVREFMTFAERVIELVGDSPTIKVQTPDGIILEYSFKEDAPYQAVPMDVGKGVVNLGVKSDGPSKLKGRGLAAFMIHQLDAYILRETLKRMRSEMGEVIMFNAIHDSYGFHPSQAQRGHEIMLEVMQELGTDRYDLFMSVLGPNNLTGKFRATTDKNGQNWDVPKRNFLEPQPAAKIPTAFS